jgi:sulfite exporter TauE/SafE
MFALIAAIFLASLLGSLHCAGMCGAFIAVATNDAGNLRRHAALQLAYHGGRLMSYLALGLAAGAAGRLLNLGGALTGLRSLAAILAGATVITFAILMLLRQSGLKISATAAPAFLTRMSRPVYRAAMNRPPLVRAAIIGLSTTLLPCGWLYAFAVTAAGTASPLRGAGTMLIFWAGTLPALIAVGAGIRTFLGPLQRRLPVATAVALLLAGLYTIAGRTRLDPIALSVTLSAHPSSIPQPGTAPCCQSDGYAHH